MSIPSSPEWTAQHVFQVILHGRETERDAVQTGLERGEIKVNNSELRQMLLKEIQEYYYPGQESEDSEIEIQWTRTWLVSALATVAENDNEVRIHLRKYLNHEYETSPWVPYWMLRSYF